VLVGRQSLAVGTEIDVVTDGTLVANTRDVALGGLVLAEGSIAEDAIVDRVLVGLLTDGFIDRGKSVARMVLGSIHDAVRAVVPVGARQALVAGANDALFTAITNGSVLELAAREAARHD
jgi:hypothetical protein